MARNVFLDEESPAIERVVDAIRDNTSRTIIQNLTHPMTASEIAETCNIPISTVYRKLDRLVEASLLTELTEIRPDGHHTTRYDLAFEEVHIQLDEDQSLTVEIGRPETKPDDRLIDLWNELRRET